MSISKVITPVLAILAASGAHAQASGGLSYDGHIALGYGFEGLSGALIYDGSLNFQTAPGAFSNGFGFEGSLTTLGELGGGNLVGFSGGLTYAGDFGKISIGRPIAPALDYSYAPTPGLVYLHLLSGYLTGSFVGLELSYLPIDEAVFGIRYDTEMGGTRVGAAVYGSPFGGETAYSVSADFAVGGGNVVLSAEGFSSSDLILHGEYSQKTGALGYGISATGVATDALFGGWVSYAFSPNLEATGILVTDGGDSAVMAEIEYTADSGIFANFGMFMDVGSPGTAGYARVGFAF